jgi:hypothetical protein
MTLTHGKWWVRSMLRENASQTFQRSFCVMWSISRSRCMLWWISCSNRQKWCRYGPYRPKWSYWVEKLWRLLLHFVSFLSPVVKRISFILFHSHCVWTFWGDRNVLVVFMQLHTSAINVFITTEISQTS